MRFARRAKALWPIITALVIIAASAVFLVSPALRRPHLNYNAGVCTSHLKMIGIALQNYHDAYHSFPPAYIADEHGAPMHSWRVLLLPHFEEEPLKQLFAEYDFSEPWNGLHNRRLMSRTPYMYRCRSDASSESNSSYLAVVGPESMWRGDKPLNIHETRDGTSTTIAVVECADSGVNWLEPRDISFEDANWGINNRSTRPSIRSRHKDGALILFMDGSVHFLTSHIKPEILRGLLTPAGGENVEIPY